MLLKSGDTLAESWRRKSALAADLPAVDIVIPFYNEANLLPGKLSNLQSLDYPGHLLRFILVDGLSTDESADIVAAAALQDDRLIFLRAPCANKTQQLNLGLMACLAPWVLMTDVDASLPADTLRELVATATHAPRVAVAGVLHRPGLAARLDRWHWQMWNISRRLECRSGSTSTVMGPCYLVRRDWMPSFPESVIADDMYVSFAALQSGWQIALTDTMVVERRGARGTLPVLYHKVRKGRAFLREVLRVLPTAGRMPSPMRELYLWRAAATLIAPVFILGIVIASLALVPEIFAPLWGLALLCCLAPVETLIPVRGGSRLVAVAAVVGLGLILAGVLCVALVSLPFFSQRVCFSRWHQEEQ